MWGRRVVVNGRGGRDQEAARAQKVEQRSLDVGHLSRPCRPRAAQQRPLPVRQRHHPVLQRLLPCAVSGEGVGCQMQAHLARAQRPARHIAFVTEVSPRPGGTPSHNCSDVEAPLSLSCPCGRSRSTAKSAASCAPLCVCARRVSSGAPSPSAWLPHPSCASLTPQGALSPCRAARAPADAAIYQTPLSQYRHVMHRKLEDTCCRRRQAQRGAVGARWLRRGGPGGRVRYGGTVRA